MHAKKSLLFSEGTPWTKKGDSIFNVGMGSFDGAETCELVGLFLLSKLQHLKLNLGLYRDDGLGVCSLTGRQTEKVKQEMCRIFERYHLQITTDVNHKIVNFLDITLDLDSGLFKPFSKPNNTILYVNKHSNHPPSITKNLPASVNKRLSSISANEGIFREAIPPYQKALNESGYSFDLKFEPDATSGPKKRTRGRKITWFNPPFSANVSTNIGARFLSIIDTCFPPTNELHKIINRNTIKISYRCMPNMRKVLSKQNSKIAKQKSVPAPVPGCNCQGGPQTCPLNGACLTDELVYKASVTRLDTNQVETYTGLTGGTFKDRYNQHMHDFRHEKNKSKTTLSKFIWKLKSENVPYEIAWQSVARARVFNPVTKKCQLCLREKYHIMFNPESATLNRRDELFNTCRHRLKLLLGKVKTN